MLAARSALLSVLLGAPTAAQETRLLDPELTVHLDVESGSEAGSRGARETGRIVIELNQAFAPRHVAQFQRLVRSGFYDGMTFYRVIDGFVAQGGDGSDLKGVFPNPKLEAEFERAWLDELPWTPVQQNDLFAPETGFVRGFAVGRDRAAGRSWLLHCPGVVAMTRNEGPDSASTDFYIVLGQAPRYLDRNMTIFGRVVLGMDVVQRVRRGERVADGVIPESEERSRIVRARIASDLPSSERLAVRVADTTHPSFEKGLEGRRHRSAPFFRRRPPPVLDICQIAVPGRVAPPGR